jgi:hypothetical protein
MAIVNIVASNDADFNRLFRYQTVGGVPIDLTGSAMVMMLRRHAKDEAAVLRIGSDTGEITLTDPSNGLFTVYIAQQVLERLALGDFEHSLIQTLLGRKHHIWSGVFTNNPGPSR